MKKTILITFAATLSFGSSFAQDQMHPVKPNIPNKSVQVAPNAGNPNPKAINPQNPVNPKGANVNPQKPIDPKGTNITPKPGPISPNKTAQESQQKPEKMQQEKQMQLQQRHHDVPHPPLPPAGGPKTK